MIAGISDTTGGAVIKNIDANSLKQNNHILLVEAGGGHCMRLHVFEHTPTAFKEVWSLGAIPRWSWSITEAGKGSAEGICRQGPREPSAQATPDGRIVVEVPVLLDPSQRTMPVNTYSFNWDGNKYVLQDEDR